MLGKKSECSFVAESNIRPSDDQFGWSSTELGSCNNDYPEGERWSSHFWGGFNGIRTQDLCDAGALLYQVSYEAT